MNLKKLYLKFSVSALVAVSLFGLVIHGTADTRYLEGFELLPLKPAAAKAASIERASAWMSTTIWPYRVPIAVNANGHQRQDQIAEVAVNFTTLLSQVGDTNAFAIDSIRLVEVDANNNIIDAHVPHQFDQDNGYDPSTNAAGTLVLQMGGITSASGQRFYQLYFGTVGTTYQAPAVDDQIIATTSGIQDEGENSYRFETSSATLFYQYESGGFSSINDADGNDWINYNTAPGASGAFRGIPNLIHPEGGFHPGDGGTTTQILHIGPLKVSYLSTDGNWQALWEIYPGSVRMTVLQTDHNYWFLYEGTPGGLLDTNDYYVLSSGATQFNAYTDTTDANDSDIANNEWVYFVDPTVATGPRAFYLVHHEDDTAVDSYRRIGSTGAGNAMTVFGFGRQGLNKLMSQTPQHFTFGFMDTDNFATASTLINGRYQDLLITVGGAEVATAAGTPGEADLVSPSGEISTSAPVYEWIATPAAADYELVIYNEAQDTILYSGSHTSASSCIGTTCTAQPSISLPAGSHRWLIRATNSFGPGPWTIYQPVSINSSPVVAITAPVDGDSFPDGTSVTFAATATDAEDGDISASISWSSSVDGSIGTGPTFDSSTLSAGSHVIAALVTDSGDKSSSASIAITIEQSNAGSLRDAVYISTVSSGTVDGVTFQNEDILAYDRVADSWSLFFDGSAHGLGGTDVDGFAIEDNGSLLLSTRTSVSLSGLGTVDDSDIVRFIPSTGTYEIYLDGSLVDLSTSGEDTDAIGLLLDGSLIISVIGPMVVGGSTIAQDEDLVLYNAANSTWSLYFDGSDVGMGATTDMDTYGVWVDPTNGDLLITTKGNFTVDGVSGTTLDVFACTAPTTGSSSECDTVEIEWSGTDLAGHVLDALSFSD